MTEYVRVLRVLEYVGSRSWIESTLAQNAVKGTRNFGNCTIREAKLGEFAEVVPAPLPKMVAEDLFGPKVTFEVNTKPTRGYWFAVHEWSRKVFFKTESGACAYCIDRKLPYSWIKYEFVQ